VVKAFYCPLFELPLPAGHAFPMVKYRRLYESVRDRGEAWGIELREPAPATDEDLRRVHCPDYVARMRSGAVRPDEMRRIGFPWSPAMVARSCLSSGATIAALRSALDGDGVAVNLAGGTHHAAHDRGGGYCVFNDSVVAARHAQAHGWLRRVLVVDLDAHHGNGTAALCADDPSVFTFSMHSARAYPALKPSSDLDVPLAAGTDDATYLDALARHLPDAIARASADAVIYLAGADPFVGDRLGGLGLSRAGLVERDRAVLVACRRAGLPVAVTMAGGYAPDVEDIVSIHLNTVRIAREHADFRPMPSVLAADA
jgi:acetoin utilization deacetylase AcuC-like enzyme